MIAKKSDCVSGHDGDLNPVTEVTVPFATNSEVPT